jgi:hypothetical protein
MSRLGYAPHSNSVTRFKEERAAFISNLEANANTLRDHPHAAGEVADSLYGLVDQVRRIKVAAVAMDAIRSDPYVRAKPYAFYSHEVPLMCKDVVASLLHWADILVNTDGRRTDDIVVQSIRQMLVSLRF